MFTFKLGNEEARGRLPVLLNRRRKLVARAYEVSGASNPMQLAESCSAFSAILADTWVRGPEFGTWDGRAETLSTFGDAVYEQLRHDYSNHEIITAGQRIVIDELVPSFNSPGAGKARDFSEAPTESKMET